MVLGMVISPPVSRSALSKSQLDDAVRAGTLQVLITPARSTSLSAWNGQHGHDLDGIARENGKVRMPVEEPGGSLVRIRSHNRECAQLIAFIVDPTLRDLLGFPQWPAHADNGGVMFLDPRLPSCYAFLFLRAAIQFGQGVPGHSSRTGFAAKENCEIGIVRAHNVSFPLRFAGWNNNSI